MDAGTVDGVTGDGAGEATVGSGRDPLLVAGPPGVTRGLDRLQSQGEIDVPVRAVEVDGGATVPGSGAGIRVLWRRGHVPHNWLEDAVASLPDLEWVHSDFVGVDTVPLDELTRRGIVFTNGVGNFSRPMAEWVVLGMLVAAKQLPHFVRQSDAGAWDPSPHLTELDGAVALFLGLGSVATTAAPMAAAFGVEVRGVARSPRSGPPPGVARLVPAQEWRRHLGEADFVVCALPLTAETAGMIDAEALAAMRPSAWLINVARGAIIDEQALVSALDRGAIGGAVLDAFTQEPLPAGHPLWGRPNVLVVPHHTWSSPRSAAREDSLFARQLRLWAGGRPLDNRVDVAAGY